MKRELEDYSIDCPYCGESVGLLLDPSVPAQSYVEDCEVCCRPMNINFSIELDGAVLLTATSDNE